MVTKEQARDIYIYYSQIEDTEKLIADLKRAIEKEKKEPNFHEIIRNISYHPHGSICINVPYFDNTKGVFDKDKGSRVYNINYPSAMKVLKAHVRILKRELRELLKATES